MAGKRKPKLKDKAQSRRFIETAKHLEVDESGKLFEQATRIVIPPKLQKQLDKKKM